MHVNSKVKLPDFYICHSSDIGNRFAGEHAEFFAKLKIVNEKRQQYWQFVPTAEELERHEVNKENV